MSVSTVRLREYRTKATQTEKAIIDYVIEARQTVPDLTVHQLAEKTFSSAASISRLCKKMGYAGYQDFQKSLIYEQAVRGSYADQNLIDFNQRDGIDDIIIGSTNRNIQAMEDSRQLMSKDNITKVVELFQQAENIGFFGIGASLLVAKDAQMKFIRVNKMAMVNDDWHTQLLVARNMSNRDVAFTISYSGETPEMIEVTKAAKENGAKIISLTSEDNSTIAQMADINLFVPSNELPLRSAATVSRLMQLNYIDVIFLAYITRSDDSIEIIERTKIKKNKKEK